MRTTGYIISIQDTTAIQAYSIHVHRTIKIDSVSWFGSETAPRPRRAGGEGVGVTTMEE